MADMKDDCMGGIRVDVEESGHGSTCERLCAKLKVWTIVWNEGGNH